MEYKILAIGDVHLKASNIHTIRILKDKIINAIREIKPDGVVILGDLHDTHQKMDTYAWLESWRFLRDISRINRFTMWAKYVMGNHDIPSNNLYLEGIHPFVGFDEDREYDSVIVDKPITVNGPWGHKWAFVPYVPNGRFREALSLIPGQYRTIFCHQEFKDSKFGSIVSKNGDEWPLDGDMIVSGHIHEAQKPQPNINYIGSPYQTNFGEDPNKTISLFVYTETDVREEKIDLGMPKKITHNVTVDQLKDLSLSSSDENRLIISDTSVNIAKFKSSKEFKEINAKVILKPTDKIFVKRDVVKKSFLTILKEYTDKESDDIRRALEEVLSAN